VQIPATPEQKSLMAKYLETMDLLKTNRLRALAEMSDEEALRQIKLLKTVEPPWRERRNWSGLVEMQDLFHRRKKK
jgi:hypothetical protein